jgi:hypothetical protein
LMNEGKTYELWWLAQAIMKMSNSNSNLHSINVSGCQKTVQPKLWKIYIFIIGLSSNFWTAQSIDLA